MERERPNIQAALNNGSPQNQPGADPPARESEAPGVPCRPSEVAPVGSPWAGGAYRSPPLPNIDGGAYAAEGPPAVDLRFPLTLVQLLELFGSRFFEYSRAKRAYVGRPKVAPEICRIIAGGDAARGQELMRAVEDAYAEYIAVQSSVSQAVAKPIP